jgi:hypothetical protein
MGWVLEAAGNIVGYLGNIPQIFHLRDRDLIAAATRDFAVAPAFRGHSVKLAAAFCQQKNVDILIDTTATEVAGRIFRLFRALPVPQRDYDKVLFVVLDAPAFLSACFRKGRYGRALSLLGSYLLAPVLRAEIVLRRRGVFRSSKMMNLETLDPCDLGPEFDDLWIRKISERKRLLSYRTAEFLRWHFGPPRVRDSVKVVCCRRPGKVVGYVAVAREEVKDIGLIRSKIVDVFVEKDDPEIIDQLFSAGLELARAQGSHVLELFGFPKETRGRFISGNPYCRRFPSWPYFYKAMDRGIQTDLENEGLWYASPFDGDASL